VTRRGARSFGAFDRFPSPRPPLLFRLSAMRFAYIDSHGNEIPIPSVDALALRIELGAVGPNTQLYDAQADHWGPAHSHEIFHTLTRDAEDDFVAPPPPVAPPTVAAGPQPDPAPAASAPADETGQAKVDSPPAGVEEDQDESDLGLTLADPPPEASGRAASGDAFGDLDRDVAFPGDPSVDGEVGEAGAPEPDEEGGFDFGVIDAAEELEDEPMELGMGAVETPPAGGFGGELALESPMDFSSGGALASDDLQFEQPMSEFRPEAPPAWMDEPPNDSIMDFSAAASAAEEEDLVPSAEAPTRQRRVPKDRPSPPKFRKDRSLSGPIVLVVILLALGVGAYVGWPIIGQRFAREEAPPAPVITLPDIPAELVPRMRSFAEAAIADVVGDADAATVDGGAPAAPGQEWLAGVYLGNASQFEGVEAFWQGMEQFVGALRAADGAAYHDRYVARLESQGVPSDTAAILTERADAGFALAAPRREESYAILERVVGASLDLHDFLVRNEANIEYRPATTSTVDPVLQAVPSTPAIGDQMWEMVDEITEALDALGSLDLVTRERLVAALAARLQQVGIE